MWFVLQVLRHAFLHTFHSAFERLLKSFFHSCLGNIQSFLLVQWTPPHNFEQSAPQLVCTVFCCLIQTITSPLTRFQSLCTPDVLTEYYAYGWCQTRTYSWTHNSLLSVMRLSSTDPPDSWWRVACMSANAPFHRLWRGNVVSILFLFFTWVKETQRNCSATLFPIYPISTQLRKRHIKSHCGKGYIEHELLSLKHHSGNQVIWRPLLNLWHRRISNFKSLILGHDISFLLHRQTLKSSELDARRNTSPPVLSQSFKWSKCDPVHFRLCEWHQRTKSETWTHAVA